MKTRNEVIEMLELGAKIQGSEHDLKSHLQIAIRELDLEFVDALLGYGIDPNPDEALDDPLHFLYHEYLAVKSTKGEAILSLFAKLLAHGVDPNRPWANNWRAYDYAKREGVGEIVGLLERYGADPQIREYI